MNNPLVSIISSSYNKADYLLQAIESVKKQTYKPIEHIIIDGGSTDNTLEILKMEENKSLIWISEKDSGQYEAVNKGFHLARGEILGWLDADDTYEKKAVSIAVNYLNSHYEVDFIYGDYNFIDDKNRLIRKHRALDFHYPTLLYNLCYISPQTVFFRREVLKKVGFLNEDFRLVGDYEFFIRIAKQCHLAHINSVLGNYRIHNERLTQNSKYQELFKAERFRIRKTQAGLENWSEIQARIFLEIMRYFYRLRRYLIMLANK